MTTKYSSESPAQIRARRIASAPASCQGVLSRALNPANTSLSAAVKSMCLECLAFDRAAIAHCSGHACPIHAVRPYQKNLDEPDDDPATSQPDPQPTQPDKPKRQISDGLLRHQQAKRDAKLSQNQNPPSTSTI